MFTTYDITVFFKDGSWLTVPLVLTKNQQDGIKQAKAVALKEGKDIDCYSLKKVY